MVRRALWLLVVGLILSVPFIGRGPVRAEGSATLQGVVTNPSDGNKPVGGQEITLHAFQGQQEARTLTASADAQGAFRFTGLEPGSDWIYLLETTYRDVVYSAGPLSYEAGQISLDAPMQVYETTTDRGQISVARAHVFMELSGSQLTVAELYVLENDGDRTYIGSDADLVQGRRWTSRFTLPAGSQELSFTDGSLGGRFLAVDGGFVDTEPLWPGQTSLMVNYAIPCPQSTCVLSRKLIYPLSSLNVFMPADNGATIASSRLAAAENVDAQGTSYLNYVGRDLAAGETIEMRLRPGPVSAPAAQGASPDPTLPWILLGVVIGLLAVSFPFWWPRIRGSRNG